jgi:N-acetylmuramoyl-L-alanine amidase
MSRLEPGDVSEGVFTINAERHDVAARDLCANMAQANILIAIDFDAAASRQSAGSSTACDPARPFAQANYGLAQLLQRNVLAELNTHGYRVSDDGVKTDAPLAGVPLTRPAEACDHLLLLGPARTGHFSSPSDVPGALVEPLFITDPDEATPMTKPDVQDLIATGIATTADQYFTRQPCESAAQGARRLPTRGRSAAYQPSVRL